MALQVSDNYSSPMFCMDYGDIRVTGVPASGLTVRYVFEMDQAGIVDELEETYYPDKTGWVTVRGVGELARRNAPAWGDRPQTGTEAYRAGCVRLDMTFTAGEDSVSLRRIFMYSDVMTENMLNQGIMSVFLTRYRTRRLLPGQPAWLGFCLYTETEHARVEVGAAYLDRPGHAAYATWTITVDSAEVYDNLVFLLVLRADIRTVLDRLEEETRREFGEDDLLWYTYTLHSPHGGSHTVRFEPERRPFPDAAVLVYQNCFGLPESIALTGAETVEAEMEGTFGTTDDAYRKLHTSLDYSHEANTGHLSPDDRAAFEDLLRSPRVFLGEIADDREVVITDVEATEEIPHAGPVNFRVTWRLANPAHRRFTALQDTLAGGVFDKSFDQSFE